LQIPLKLRLDQLPSATTSTVKEELLERVSPAGLYPGQPRGRTADEIRKIKSETPSQEVKAPAHRSITPPLRYDIHHQSICFFLNLFCFQASRLYSFPVLDFLPGMLQNSSPTSCIHQAAMAVSRMTLADRYSGKDVRLQTGQEYGRALSFTNATIRDSSTNIQDETVVSVWLLGLYELISSVLTHARTASQARNLEEEYQSHLSHIRGAMNLLTLRGKSQFTTARGEKVYRILKAAIQMRLFVLNSVTSKDFNNLEIDIYRDEHEFVPSETANRATSYFYKVSHLFEQIKHFLTRKFERGEAAKRHAAYLIHCGESIDAEMTGWSKVEPGWDMMKIPADTAGTTWALYPCHAVYYFYSFWVYLYWLRYLIARVKLYEALIELVKADVAGMSLSTSGGRPSPTTTDSQISHYRAIVQRMTAEIVGLTAYALGDVTPTGHFQSAAVFTHHARRGLQEINVIAAMQLVIPLKTLQRSEHPTPTQKGAIDLAISHIGDGLRRQPLVFS